MNRRQLLACGAYSLFARSPERVQEPTFTSEVKVVNLFATVHNKAGEIIRDLAKDDFVLFENGKRQIIRYFSRETDLPLTVGLLVDSSFSQTQVLEDERAATVRFFSQVLREDRDKATIVQFDQAVIIRQDLTSSTKDLSDTLALVDSPSRQDAINGSGTLLYDAIRQASIQLMRAQKGRKAFIALTDGEDVGSAVTLNDAIEAAQRAGTLVYSILFSDASFRRGNFSGGGGGKSVLQRLSRETGGRFYQVSQAQSIADIFAAIETELRSQYSLGFISDQATVTSGFRKVRLVTKAKGLLVDAPDRYYAET